MNEHQNPVSSQFTFTANGNHLEIVNTNTAVSNSEAYIDSLDPHVATSHGSQLVYTDPNEAGVVTDQDGNTYMQTNEEGDVMYSHESSDVLQQQQQEQPEADVVEPEMEPIDLEEVQKIQARMPVADPNAPVGSNKNPIRIIQQGNQYITTQDVSDEHLQQIIQVLTNQALISSSSSRPSAIYNRLTNRRIIFRVTRAKRRAEDTATNRQGARSAFGPDRTRSGVSKAKTRISPGKGGGGGSRKRRRRDSGEEDPDFEPEVPEEEILPFPLARRTSTSGRVSKPPKHLIKDYKHLRLEDMTTKPESSMEDDHSDGGYSDYVNDGMSDEMPSDGENKNGLRFPCSFCKKIFATGNGLSRHETASHGSGQGSKARQSNPYVVGMKRRAKLKEAVAEATDDELVEFVAPRLAKLISPWDHLLYHSEDGDPPLPQITRVVLDYLNLAERARAFLGDHLELRSPLVVPSSSPPPTLPPPPSSSLTAATTNAVDGVGSEAVVSSAPDGTAPQEIDHSTALTAPADAFDPLSNTQHVPTLADLARINANGLLASSTTSPPEEQPSLATNGTIQLHEHPVEEDAVLREALTVGDNGADTVDLNDDDDDDGSIIVKIDTDEQSGALGLSKGTYVIKGPLREEYLPRRFRSILAAQYAAALGVASDSHHQSIAPGSILATTTAIGQPDGEADYVATGYGESAEADSGLPLDAQSQGLMTLGDELLLLPEGGLGGPVPDEWLASGAFLAVLTENGETSDLVMEAATGRLFHRPTGHLVSLSGDPNAPEEVAQIDQQQLETTANVPGKAPILPDYGAYEDEVPSTDGSTSVSKSTNAQERRIPSTSTTRSKPRPKSKQKQHRQATSSPKPVSPIAIVDEEQANRDRLLQQMAVSGEVVDINALFPGVSVTEVSPGVCLVTKPNGDRFNVEHGGEGITLETLQTILQMDA